MNQTAEYNPLSQQHEIDIPVATTPQPNLPRPDLFIGTREDYIKIGIPLYDASINGDWEAAKVILDKNPELVRCSITENCETPLHIAASARGKRMEKLVENLVNLMEKDDLALQNKNFNTALCLAAMAGTIKMVEKTVEKNNTLLSIPGSEGMMPLCMATLSGHHEMVKHLYDNSKKLQDNGWTHQNRRWLLSRCVQYDMFDVALQMVKDCPELSSDGSVLGILAQKPDAFLRTKPGSMQRANGLMYYGEDSEGLQLLKIIWKNIAKKPKNEIDDILRGPPDEIKQDDKPPFGNDDQVLKLIRGPAAKISKDPNVPSLENAKKSHSSRILFVAAEMGNTQFLVELIRLYQDLIWKVNDNNQTIFHVAVEHRNERIYNILYEVRSMKELITPLRDRNDNNMLHLVGKRAKKEPLQDVSGLALHMQRELLWFKEVETMIPPSCRKQKNKDGLTPYELFTKEHKDLVTQAEKWTKDVAGQFIVVAALIATIVFAVAFTIPGGYNQNDGIPIFYRNVTFLVFVLADAISFLSSASSILMFLNILSSRYAERDFLVKLPMELMHGQQTLFISIITMAITFILSFFVLYHNDLKWIPILIGVCAPFALYRFFSIQYPLLDEMFKSTFGSRYTSLGLVNPFSTMKTPSSSHSCFQL